ncbi:6585_t:CDS:1, partial [Cetraspora pellucida]
EDPSNQTIVFWFQDILIKKYKEYYNSIKFEDYDYVILDRSHLDTYFFTVNGIKDDFYKKLYLPYLDENLNNINLKYEQIIINIYVDKNISIERIGERECNIEKGVDVEYFKSMYESYFKNIDK